MNDLENQLYSALARFDQKQGGGRGGRRKGAGRKPTGRVGKRMQFVISPQNAERLRFVGNKSRFVNEAIQLKASAPAP